jgi:predicted ATPase
VPWFAFGEALNAAFVTAPSRLRTRLLNKRPEIQAVLPDFAPARQVSQTDDLQLRVFRAVEELLRAIVVRQPIVLVLEDLHWADGASLGLLLYLGRNLPELRILIVGTYRHVEVASEDPLSLTLRELRREAGIEEIVLRGLPLQTTREFVGAFLGTDDVAEEFVSVVHTRTSGNPLPPGHASVRN